MRNRELGDERLAVRAPSWVTINERFPSTSIIRMLEGIRMLMRPEQSADVRAFFSDRGVPQAAKTLEQLVERQQINAALRTRSRDPLATLTPLSVWPTVLGDTRGAPVKRLAGLRRRRGHGPGLLERSTPGIA